ncbi:hypothetical protein DUHN55_14870 [Helicobacter pylori]
MNLTPRSCLSGAALGAEPHRFGYALAHWVDALIDAPVPRHGGDEALRRRPEHLTPSDDDRDNRAQWMLRRQSPVAARVITLFRYRPAGVTRPGPPNRRAVATTTGASTPRAESSTPIHHMAALLGQQ